MRMTRQQLHDDDDGPAGVAGCDPAPTAWVLLPTT